ARASEQRTLAEYARSRTTAHSPESSVLDSRPDRPWRRSAPVFPLPDSRRGIVAIPDALDESRRFGGPHIGRSPIPEGPDPLWHRSRPIRRSGPRVVADWSTLPQT